MSNTVTERADTTHEIGKITDEDIARARRTIGIPTPERSTSWVDAADAS